jgi:hypothetical protein
VADLDSADLTQLFTGQRYDRIVLADVLEHLKNPERILQQCHQLLQAGGQLLTSVPNVAYCGLLAELLQGEFEYRPEGLLDSTHLRFFTRQSLHRFFAQHGWQVTTSQTTTRDVLASEFKGQFNLLPPAVSRHLLALPDAATYQFISCLEPLPPGEISTAAELPNPPWHCLCFRPRCIWRLTAILTRRAKKCVQAPWGVTFKPCVLPYPPSRRVATRACGSTQQTARASCASCA